MSMDEQILRAKEEASSRMAIMEKVEKWILARDEERWLEEYNRVSFCIYVVLYDKFPPCFYHFHNMVLNQVCFQDENRYSVSRGAHKNLRRAERARITANKLPGDEFLYATLLHTNDKPESFQGLSALT